MVKKGVILCGGLGTRFLPITKAVPKEMLPIIDRPVVDYIVDEAVNSGIKEILIIISPNKDCIKEYYQPNPELYQKLMESGKQDYARVIDQIPQKANVSFDVQYIPKGSGDALLIAQEFVSGEPFALMLGDDVMYNDQNPVVKQLISVYEKYQKTVLGVQRRTPPEIFRYGVIDILERLEPDVYDMKGILEKPSSVDDLTSDLATLGRYILTPEIFEILKKTPLGINNELQLTDGINLLAQQSGALAYVFEGRRYDMGNKLGSLEAITEYALRDQELGKAYKEYLTELLKNIQKVFFKTN
ncbi:MAG TPA: UTP--glucose-1-phosphate uridylyltransferase [Clostridiales bacterium]|jgi:UTP--glucose-1-phosphate uridylyltransferase|nr:UTP--glucose-1-phosphate uridylyltransferase [Clostridiales bacterium]